MSIVIQLPIGLRDELARIPESSMGAQRLDVVLEGGETVFDVKIFNGEQAHSASHFDPARIVAFRDKEGREWRVRN